MTLKPELEPSCRDRWPWSDGASRYVSRPKANHGGYVADVPTAPVMGISGRIIQIDVVSCTLDTEAEIYQRKSRIATIEQGELER